ncbi:MULTISPECIES: hypothetical protein [unclassified Microbacterium]|uniref:hypothetical protein n=1 Tax=unclassified Microbacterium TaxID=2609290 RepID=UPI0030170B6F
MDITKTVEPRSDQLNFDDVATAPMTITVESVKQGPPDQPVELHNTEHPGRPYKPGKSMRRVLIAAWGTDAAEYVGRRIELYGDPTIKFGRDAVGGIRIRALSHIDKPLTVALTVTRGKREPYTVQPIKDTTDPTKLADALADITSAGSIEALKTAWALAEKRGVQKHPDVITATNKRKAELESA